MEYKNEIPTNKPIRIHTDTLASICLPTSVAPFHRVRSDFYLVRVSV